MINIILNCAIKLTKLLQSFLKSLNFLKVDSSMLYLNFAFYVYTIPALQMSDNVLSEQNHFSTSAGGTIEMFSKTIEFGGG